MEFFEAWDWFKRITSVLVLASLALYLLRFLATGHIMSLAEFQEYVKGLFLYFIK